MNHSTKTPTKAEQSRLDALAAMRCVCCEIEGVHQPFHTEVHHLVDKGYRKHSGGHMATLPLDLWHHRGIVKPGWTSTEMYAHYGPSLALQKREFVATYGTERELLARVNSKLEAVEFG